MGKVKRVVLLFPCVGRRVSLIRLFAESAEELGYKPVLVGTETNERSPAWQLCDKRYLVRPVAQAGYAQEIMDIARKEKADLLIPTVDLDLKIWAKHRAELVASGCRVLIGAEDMVAACEDKVLMYKQLREHGFDTPQTWTAEEIAARKRLRFPMFLKPRDGHASRGSTVVNDREELDFYIKRIPNCIAQDFIAGDEYTVDVLTDFEGKIRCAVPRRRIEVRAGEVSKSMTVKNHTIIDACLDLLKTLGSGPGITTIQLFLTPDNAVKFIEINPRFGGGIPLSIQAGANFPKWILQWWLGQKPRIRMDGWRDGLMMLRYDEAVWVSGK